jgi:hypothetical protein
MNIQLVQYPASSIEDHALEKDKLRDRALMLISPS